MRTLHGPVALVFADAGEEGRGMLAELKERSEESRRAGAYNYSHPNPEIRTAGRPHSRAGTTVAVIVRAAVMEPVRELQEALGLPFYVLWDEAGRVHNTYDLAKRHHLDDGGRNLPPPSELRALLEWVFSGKGLYAR